MSQAYLKKLLAKDRSFANLVAALTGSGARPLSILAVDGTLLLGEAPASSTPRTKIEVGEDIAGWVCGEVAAAAVIAQLLEAALNREQEKRALATEILDKYRELNLHYTLAERLLEEPDPAAIARLALAEAARFIQLSAGWVLLVDGKQPSTLGRTGHELRLKARRDGNNDLLAHVLSSRETVIQNDAAADHYFEASALNRCALLCAPLKTDQRVLGAILLAAAPPVSYSAHDRKLLNTVALQVAPALEMARLYQVAVEKARMERELQLAHQVQAGLIPHETPQVAGWQFAAYWRPARELSGDYYDFIEENDGHVGLVIGDVSDKGLPSALFMVHTRAAVRSAMRHSLTVAETLIEANRLVEREASKGNFVTLFCALLDTASGELRFANAGHNPALLYHANDQRIIPLMRTGLPLGISGEASYQENKVILEAGDVLVLYTDGLTEGYNTEFEEFGVARLETAIRAGAGGNAAELVGAIERAVDGFVGGGPPYDDLTLVAVKRVTPP
jgi:phosphoserine phosphatase RsbU/P